MSVARHRGKLYLKFSKVAPTENTNVSNHFTPTYVRNITVIHVGGVNLANVDAIMAVTIIRDNSPECISIRFYITVPLL